jgi:hypothetical protein
MNTTTHPTTCEVCEKTAATGRHPCRFEKACSCWRGVPCTARAPEWRRRSLEGRSRFAAVTDTTGLVAL